jgi:hypothetical protein
MQLDIQDDQDIINHEGIIGEMLIHGIIEEDWKGVDFNILNGPCYTIDIYDAIYVLVLTIIQQWLTSRRLILLLIGGGLMRCEETMLAFWILRKLRREDPY